MTSMATPCRFAIRRAVDLVLTSLEYNEMTSTVTLVTDLSFITGWTKAITVFTASDVFLKASFPGCSRRHLFVEHIALGYFSVSTLSLSRHSFSTTPTCTSTTSRSPIEFGI
jgi:hypothetical protein